MADSYPNQEVYERYQFKCAYCGIDGSRDFEIWYLANFAVDHIKPKKHGGKDAAENYALACHSCNLYKGSADCSSIEEAKEIIKRKKSEALAWYRKNVLKEG